MYRFNRMTLMSDGAPEQVVVVLVRNSEETLEAVGEEDVLAVLPLHSLALSLCRHRAHWLGHRPARPGEELHLDVGVDDGLEEDGLVGLGAVVRLDLGGDVARLEAAVLPGHVLAVLVARPDLLASSIEDPIGVALLLGDGLTDRHHLDLRQYFDWARLALDGLEVVYLEAVVSGADCALVVLALREAHNLTLVNRNIPADILGPLHAVSPELVVAELHSGLVEGEVSVAGDVNAVLTAVLGCPDCEGEREESE